MIKIDRGHFSNMPLSGEPYGWPVKERVGVVKPPFFTPQEVYVTTCYDEMPTMTEKEISEWTRRTMDTRVREALRQIRIVKSTLAALGNITNADDVVSAESQAFTLEKNIERIIDGLPERTAGTVAHGEGDRAGGDIPHQDKA